MIRQGVLCLVLMAFWAGPLAAESAPAPAPEEGAEGEAAAELTYIPVPLNVAGVDYAAEVSPHDGAPADLRLLRADGASMADQGYLVPELGKMACAEAGYRFDAGLPALLSSDGSWMVTGGCR